jgi:hypothetical protein
LIIDAWAQHPTLRHARDLLFLDGNGVPVFRL